MWHFRNHEESSGYRHCAGRGAYFRGGFGRFGHGRGHGDGGGFGRRRGLYDGDELRLVLLSLIAENPRHGYDLIKEIEERSGGLYVPSPGVIYPTLTMLEDMGLIVESDAPGTRKVYAATPEGRTHLGENKEQVEQLLARMRELKSMQKGDTAPVRRAMRNLHAALAEKLTRADSDEAMHKIAALLDEATQKIERS